MDRREFVIGAASGLAAVALTKAAAADSHGAHAGHGGHGGAADPRVSGLLETTLECQQAAADCIRHCLELLGTGDKSLASCMDRVMRMQAVTQATHAVAAADRAPSARTKDLVAVCADFCNDCAAECEPHAEMHAACKACLDACRACVEACDAYAA